MSIRPMTPEEIRKGLRRAAQVCIEKDCTNWYSLSVCVADATYHTALVMLEEAYDGYERDPEHAAHFLLLVAEATDGR